MSAGSGACVSPILTKWLSHSENSVTTVTVLDHSYLEQPKPCMEAAFHFSSWTGARRETEQPTSLLSAAMLNAFSAMSTSILLDFRYSLKPCRIHSMGKKHLVVFNDWQEENVSAPVSVSTPGNGEAGSPLAAMREGSCVL